VWERLRNGRLIAWEKDAAIRFPAWQFENADVARGVEAVLRVFRCRFELIAISFFLRKCSEFEDRRPLDLIRSGQTARVLEYIRTYEERTRAERQLQYKNGLRTDEPMLGIPDIAKMRGWGGNRAIMRTMLLLEYFDRGLQHGVLKGWLERRNPGLDEGVPAELCQRGLWSLLADHLDEMLSGTQREGYKT